MVIALSIPTCWCNNQMMPDPLTTRLAEIRVRIAKATRGPWVIEDSPSGHDWSVGPIEHYMGGSYKPEYQTMQKHQVRVLTVLKAPIHYNDNHSKTEQGFANATLVSHAPTDLTWLCDTLEAVRTVVETLELILPLAKGYAAEHPVGSNHAYVSQAQDALTAFTTHHGD